VLTVVSTPPELLYDLRRRVLRNNDPAQNVADPRDHEEAALHLAVFRAEDLVGCGSFYPSPPPFPAEGLTYQLRYLATDESVQRQGVGSRLLAAAEDLLRSRGVQLLWANGRDTALAFYDHEGWTRHVGSEHRSPETGLPHTVISKVLAAHDPVTMDTVRADDVEALMDLRRQMFFSNQLQPVDGAFITNFGPHFLRGLAAGTTTGLVMRDPHGAVVAAALADLVVGMPMRSTPRGRTGYVHTVVTRAAFRRRGLSRQLLEALLPLVWSWDVDAIDLHATGFGEGLYRELGFTERRTGLAMRLSR
jgi:GNAT superfamily N-acetyltransferase